MNQKEAVAAMCECVHAFVLERIRGKMMCGACSCCERDAHCAFSKLFSKYLNIMYTTYVQACLCL